MKKPIEGLFQVLNEIEAKAKYSIINADNSNLDEVYNHNLKVWYYRKSDKRDLVNEEIEPINFKSKDPDSLNCSRSVNGVSLSESLFIEEELLLLSKLNRVSLQLDEKVHYDNYINFLNSKLKGLGSNRTKDKYKENWFVVGQLFASGEMDDLLKRFNRNFTQIAKFLKPNTPEGKEPYKGIRPYISQSANNTTITDKNIFSCPNKILLIQQYCIDNKIEMTDHFKNLKQPV